MGKDWLNDKIGTKLLGSKTLTGEIVFKHHTASLAISLTNKEQL